jgi:hypothetical protein
MASTLAAMVAEASKQAVRSVELAAAATQSKGATLEAVVALGRETIGNLPYFEDLGLAGDTDFLFSLGRRVRAYGCRPRKALRRALLTRAPRAPRAAWPMRATWRPRWRPCWCRTARRRQRR